MQTIEERDEIYQALLTKVEKECISELSLDKITTSWQNQEISNFEYLMHLNQAAYRTFCDLTQL